MSQVTLNESMKKPDVKLSLDGSEAKNPLPLEVTENLSCSNCKGILKPYSRCFDCKQIIQLICYKCQIEINLSDHTECHKNVSISNRITNFKKRSYTVYDELKNKVKDLYHIPYYSLSRIFNLI